MKIKKIYLFPFLFIIFCFTLLKKDWNSVYAVSNGVSVTCNNKKDCEVFFDLLDNDTCGITLQDQINEVNTIVEKQNINSFKFYPAIRDTLTPEEWTTLKEGLDFSRMKSFDASEIKISTGVLPDMAFTKDGNGTLIYTLYLPQVNTITVESFKGISNKMNISNLYIPDTVTSIESGAITNALELDYSSPSFGFISRANTSVYIEGDISNFYNELKSINVNRLVINLSKQSQLGTIAYFKDLDLEYLQIDDQLPINVDLDQLFGDNPNKKSFAVLFTHSTQCSEFNATSFPKLSSHHYDDGVTTSYVLTNSSVTDVPAVAIVPQSVNFDISSNRIDFTKASNKAFYEANKDNHTLGNQKPKLNISKIDDIIVTVGDTAPTITPTFVYADGTAVNFEDPCPEWMDRTYFQSYTANVTSKDNTSLDMNKAGTYTRKFYAPNGEEIGTAKIIVGESTVAKETPTITLISDTSTTTTSDDEITFTATMGKTGTKDLNTNATITFKNGDSELAKVNVTDGKSTYKGKLAANSHTIKAIYSGNTDFKTVTSSDLSITVLASTNPSLTAQTIGFEHAQQELTYGDQVVNNPIVQSNPHGTGEIIYTSSNPLIASVDTNGDVTIHKAGSVSITAEIAADATYAGTKGSYTHVIKPKSIQLQGYTMKDKEYDGTKTASFGKGTITLSGILTKDENDLGLTEGNLVLESANVGTHKVSFENFALSGNAKDNYTLEYPELQAEITKAPLQIVVHDVDKKQGTANPAFTYLMTGFKNNENEAMISGYTMPSLSSTATIDSPIGDYEIIAEGAIADNYSFTYVNGTLHIEANDGVVQDDYEITGTMGKNSWYVSEAIIKPSSGFTEIWNGTTWTNELRFGDDTNQEVQFKLRKSDGTSSEEFTKTIKVDTSKPSIDNLEDGATYYLNRNFICNDTNLSKVTIDGKEVTDFSALQLVGNASKSTTIVVEDAAGNTTTLHVVTKPIDDIQESIKELDENTVTQEDEATINAVLKEVNELLADKSYQPSSEQKDKLIEQKEKCEALLKTLKSTPKEEAKDEIKEEVKETTSDKAIEETVQEGVSTGDTQTMKPLLIFALAITGITFSLRTIRKDEK